MGLRFVRHNNWDQHQFSLGFKGQIGRLILVLIFRFGNKWGRTRQNGYERKENETPSQIQHDVLSKPAGRQADRAAGTCGGAVSPRLIPQLLGWWKSNALRRDKKYQVT